MIQGYRPRSQPAVGRKAKRAAVDDGSAAVGVARIVDEQTAVVLIGPAIEVAAGVAVAPVTDQAAGAGDQAFDHQLARKN